MWGRGDCNTTCFSAKAVQLAAGNTAAYSDRIQQQITRRYKRRLSGVVIMLDRYYNNLWRRCTMNYLDEIPEYSTDVAHHCVGDLAVVIPISTCEVKEVPKVTNNQKLPTDLLEAGEVRNALEFQHFFRIRDFSDIKFTYQFEQCKMVLQDLKSWYCQIELYPKDKQKIAFTMEHEMWQFIVMPRRLQCLLENLSGVP